MSTPKFAHVDTAKPDGFYVQFERQLLDDEDASPNEYLFQDPDYAEADQARLDAFDAGNWRFVGIRAVARCLIVTHGVGTYVNLESPGLWSIESDSGESYFNEVFEAEKSTLLSMIEAMRNPIIEA